MGSLLYRVLAAGCLVCAVALAGCSRGGGREHAGHGAEPVKEHAGHAQPAPPGGEHAGHAQAIPSGGEMAGPAAGVPSGYAPILVDAAQLRAFGLRTTKVEQRHLVRALRTVGIVALDETRTAHVHAHVRGYIETVPANFTGKTVKRGEALCGIFSHEVLAAQLELISLVRQKRTLAGAQAGQLLGDASSSWDALLAASRQRLLVWNVPRGLVERVERTLEPVRTFTLSAPRAGVIVAKRAFVGAYVEPGTELYVISDLSKLWVQIDVYEADLPHVRLGDSVKLAIEGVSETVTGTISYLAPTIDEATRTLKARLDVDNATGTLRPGAFVNAELSLMVGHGLVVPESAVIRTGTRNIVFVVHGGEHIQPREVKLGPLVEGAYRVDAGVTAGEEVATGAQFLIDSESRLRATSSPGGAHAGH